MIGLLLLLSLPNILCSNITIAIIGSNDIHGTAFPAQMVRQDTHEGYNYGGLPVMGGLINIIKGEYPGRVMYLDAGDQFQGGIESSKLISQGKIMNDFFGLMELNGSAIGNHQFDFGPNFLLPFMKSKDAPNLAVNLRSERNEQNFLPNQESSHIYEFDGGIRIGVIGLATVETPITTSGFTSHLFPDYKFLNYTDIVIKESKELRRKGVHAVLILSHVGNGCNPGFKYGIWKKDTQQVPCPDSDEMTVLIKSLPAGTVDGVIQGHRHTVVHHFIKGIPVMGNINGGYYFNVMYLTFDSHKKIVDVAIQGPIPVCQRVFENTGRCSYMTEEDLKEAGELVRWRFHNHDVIPDPRVNIVYEQEWKPLMKPYLVKLLNNEVFLHSIYTGECQLANLINNVMHANFSDTDFGVLNPGGFRTQWMPGILQEKDLYNMFPFDNMLQSFTINGDELLKMLSIVQAGDKGLYQFYGIQTTVKVEGEKRTLVSAKLMNGTEIEKDKQYSGVTTDFLLLGGDDFKKVINVTYTPRNVTNRGPFRDSIRQPLKDLEVIEPGTLIDPQNPRIILV